jgi:allantoin racemase
MTIDPTPLGRRDFRFLLVQAFSLSERASYRLRAMEGSKEARLMNHDRLAGLLADVSWDLHPGALSPHGDWPVETREEFLIVGASRLPIVRKACQSGLYNAIILLGGGDPGFPEAREIARSFGVPVTACAHAQMQVAAMLGDRFSIIDISEAHNMQMASLVTQYRQADRCASIRNINFPLPRPHGAPTAALEEERARVERGENSAMLDAAVEASVAAIEEDCAEVLMLGCSAAYWLQEPLQDRLQALGWEVPVLEGYRCAIEQAKMLVNLNLDVSGLAFPSDQPRQWRRRKLVG